MIQAGKAISPRHTQDLLFTLLVLVLGALLLLWRLDDMYLWQDEAETGLIARPLQRYGLPLSTDGRDWVQQAPEDYREFNRDYIWTLHPWLQYWVTAASFAVLGVTTFAARFPFALAGLATLLALCQFALRWLRHSLSARVAGALLLLCVPFLVLVRQCRYYLLSALVALPATSWIEQSRAIRWRSELWMYTQELTHPYQGPDEGLVAYLSMHATPDQTVLVNCEDLPLQLYTDLRVLGGLSGHGVTPDIRPEWVIDRQHGPCRDLLAGILAAGSYERITIPYPDIRWENREEARQHPYITVQDEDDVVLYRRVGG